MKCGNILHVLGKRKFGIKYKMENVNKQGGAGFMY